MRERNNGTWLGRPSTCHCLNAEEHNWVRHVGSHVLRKMGYLCVNVSHERVALPAPHVLDLDVGVAICLNALMHV